MLIVPLSGCSQSITDKFPEVLDDFNELDYEALTNISKNKEMSYKELCDAFIQENMDKDFKKTFKYIKENLNLENPSIFTKEKTLSFSYDMSFEKYNIDGNIHFIVSRENSKLSKIYFDYNPEWKFGNAAIINIIERKEFLNSMGLEIYNKISNDTYKTNKVYIRENGHYYAPIENNEITMYTNTDILENDGYISEKEFYEKMYDESGIMSEEEVDKIVEDTKNDVKQFKEDWNEINDAIKSSYH